MAQTGTFNLTEEEQMIGPNKVNYNNSVANNNALNALNLILRVTTDPVVSSALTNMISGVRDGLDNFGYKVFGWARDVDPGTIANYFFNPGPADKIRKNSKFVDPQGVDEVIDQIDNMLQDAETLVHLFKDPKQAERFLDLIDRCLQDNDTKYFRLCLYTYLRAGR